MMTLYTFGPAFGLPDPSPFVTKVEILLKMAGLPYRTETNGFGKAPKGKLPYIDDDGERIADSTFIRWHNEKTYNFDFDRGLSAEQRASRWVTREHPKIDRIACPWLVSRFVDPFAEFIYVPANTVAGFAKDKGAIPYDIKDVEFGHVGDRCSFDAIVSAYDIHDAALDQLATIVRGADTSRPDLTPQCEGLLAISHGLSSNFPDDHEMLKHGLVIYDALYRWCRLQNAKH